MLGEPKQVGNDASGTPAAAWWRDELWLAYQASDGTLMLQSVDVLGDPSFPTTFATGLPCGGAASLASDGRRLHVACGEPGVSYRRASTLDGTAFTAPVPLPVDQGFVGTSAFTVYADGLALLWAEDSGGLAHPVTSDDGGSTWSDAELPIRVLPEPGLCTAPGSRRLFMVYGERSGGPGSFTVAAVDPATAAVADSVSAPTPVRPGSTAICRTNYHNRPGLHVAVKHQDGFTARTTSAGLVAFGGTEAFGASAAGVSLAFDGIRAPGSPGGTSCTRRSGSPPLPVRRAHVRLARHDHPIRRRRLLHRVQHDRPRRTPLRRTGRLLRPQPRCCPAAQARRRGAEDPEELPAVPDVGASTATSTTSASPQDGGCTSTSPRGSVTRSIWH